MFPNTGKQLVVEKKKKNSITTTILVSELVSVGKIEDDLHQANLAIAEWHKKCGDLQKETDSGKTCTYEYAEENITQQDDENLEQLLFLLDKFCVSDELYHELTILYKDLPRSYLIKQMRSDLTKLCHIEKAREKAPGIYPGAQISFLDTLKEHIADFLKSNPNYPMEEPMKVKIRGDGVKMSRTTNFMLLSFSLL